jgi:hypothetical protein
MFALFMLIAIGVLGLIGAVWWNVARRKAQAQSWPTVEGRITQSGIQQRTDANGDLEYLPQVRYDYTVNGAVLQGQRIRFGLMGLDHKRAVALCDLYLVGSATTVHYNPEKPQDSVLELGNAKASPAQG